MARYIIHGAGAVGGLIGATLALADHDVLLIARGTHAEALAQRGLRLLTPTSDQIVELPVFTRAADIRFKDDDTVILAMKTQDAWSALTELASLASPEATIVCAQNGLESERLALRLFEHVYGSFVFVHTAITNDGTIASYSSGGHGILDIGKYPQGSDDRAAIIAATLREVGFDAVIRSDIMRWKRGKLLINTGNAVLACCTPSDEANELILQARREAELCFQAAGLDFASLDEIGLRTRSGMPTMAIDGSSFPGSSTYQSLARGRQATEVDYMSGEISLLGRTYGVATPVNSLFQVATREIVRLKLRPRSLSAEQFRRLANSRGELDRA